MSDQQRRTARVRPQLEPVDLAMRDVLTLAAVARVRLAERLDLPLRDVEALEHVMTDRDAQIGPNELSRRLGVTTAAATMAVQRLERAGHLTRLPHPQDRRRHVLSVTPSGAAHVMAELGPLLTRLTAVLADFDADERETIQRYLTASADAYRAYLQESPRP